MARMSACRLSLFLVSFRFVLPYLLKKKKCEHPECPGLPFASQVMEDVIFRASEVNFKDKIDEIILILLK